MTFNGRMKLGCKLPELKSTVNSDIPLTPKELALWLSQLPLLNIKQLAHQIPEYLQEINLIEMPDKQRLKMLEQLRPIVAHIYESSTKRFRGDVLNLSAESQEIQWLMNVLIGEMAIGYQRLLFNMAEKSPNWFNKKHYAVLAQRAAYYLGERVYLAYILSSLVPDDAWQELNATYAFSRELNLNTIKLKDKFAYFASKKGDINSVYNRIVLLSMVAPYSLRGAELEQIYYGLSPWMNDLKLLKVSEAASTQGYLYIVDLDEDKGVLSCSYIQAGGNQYILDSTELDFKLTRWLESGEGPESAAYKGMSKTLLIDIISKLESTKQRAEERIHTHGERVEVVIGLENIDLFLTHVHSVLNNDGHSPIPRIQIEQFTNDVFWGEHEEGDWDQLDFSTHQVAQGKGETVGEEISGSEVRRHLFNIENESKFGVCLSCSSLQGSGLFIGELIFIQGYEPEIWTLGIIRWMTVKNKKLEIGLYLLSARVDKVIVNSKDSVDNNTINALWMAEGEYGDTILLPRAKFQVGEQLQLTLKGEHLDVSLGKIVWQSEGFSQFCLIIENKEPEKSSNQQDFLI